MSPADTIRSVYEAFGRGDVHAIVERLAPDAWWDCDRAPNDVPWLQPLGVDTRCRNSSPRWPNIWTCVASNPWRSGKRLFGARHVQH